VPLFETPARVGHRDYSAIASCIAASTPVTLYTLPYDNSTAIIRKVMIFNGQTAPVTVQIGYTPSGGIFTKQLIDLYAINGQDNEWTEDQLVAYEFPANASAGGTTVIQVQASAAGSAPNDVRVQIEVEVFPGSSVHA
jgi:hypothetical protein